MVYIILDILVIFSISAIFCISNWGWETSGSARFCSCSKSVQWRTMGCSSMSVPMFLCWRSTMGQEKLVIFCIFCIFCILCILHIFWWVLFLTSAWVNAYQSSIIYERREQAQVLYVIPVSSILGRLPVVPVGEKGTIPYDMRRESSDFPGASCDKSQNSGDGCRWWYVNSWALGWGTKQ